MTETTNDNPNDRYETVKVYSAAQNAKIEAYRSFNEASRAKIRSPWENPEQEVRRLRQMTPAEQWSMFDIISKTMEMISQLVDDIDGLVDNDPQ